MGDRICISVVDDCERSPTLYCHWDGLRAVRAANAAIKESRMEASNVLCNTLIILCGGKTWDRNYYLYNAGKAAGMADFDWGDWTLWLNGETWLYTNETSNGRVTAEYSIEEAEAFAISKGYRRDAQDN